MIQESNEFISNLKRRALKDQESKLKTLGHHKELAQQLLKPDLPSLINPQPLVDDSPSPYLSTNQENFEKLSAKKEHKKKTKLNSKQSTEKVHKTDKEYQQGADLKLQKENETKAGADPNDRHQKIRMSNSMLSHPERHQKMIQVGSFHKEGYFLHKHNASVGQISEISSIEMIKQKYHEAKTSKQVLKTQNMEERLESGVKTRLDTEGMELDDRFLQEERQGSQE